MAITLNGTTGITTPADSVTGNATVGGTLNVTGATALSNTLSVAGATTMTGGIAGDVAATGTVAMASSFKRNRIINGNMLIDQRNAGASVTPTVGLYTLDRWVLNVSAASKVSVQQNAGSVTPPVGFTNYAGLTSTSAYTVASGDYISFGHLIEGFNIADLGWGTANAKTIAVSFWVRSSLTGTFGGVVQNGSFTRSYPFTYTISSANTWEQKTITIAGDTTGTWATNNTAGMILVFGIGVGSTYSGTAGAWAATNYTSATGATNIVSTSGATWYITGVQLEVGTVATPYEMQIYSDQLAQCQRYFEKSYADSTVPGAVLTAGQLSIGANAGGFTFPFNVRKRTAPTVVGYDASGASGKASYYSGSWSNGASYTVITGYQNGIFIQVNVGAQFNCEFTASAEL